MNAPSDAPEIAPLDARHERDAVAVLARAFRDNPLNLRVLGSAAPEQRVRANAHGVRALLPVARMHGRVLAARCDARLAGVLIATPPSAWPLPPAPPLARLRCLLGQGRRVARRWREVFEALAPLHPPEPHWYLGTLGVEPTQQQRGVGSALLARWLAQVDAGGHPAYLETDVRANVVFYQRWGFALVGETRILGAPVWRMRRAPRPFSQPAHGY